MANKRLQATITIGGAVAGSLASAFGTVTNQVNRVGSALRRLETEQRTVSQAINTFGRMGRNVDGLRDRYARLTAQVERLRGAHEQLNRVQRAQDANLSARANYRGQMVDAVAIGVAASAPLVQAAQFETAMLGVAKQVEGARDSSGQLTAVYHDMAKSIQELGREIPLATNDLADMVAAGARMGVARDELIGFTRTAAMMADAFELPAGELADSMGKIAGLFKIPIPAIGSLADAINYLDDNAISKGGDIVDFLVRTGGAAASVKIGAQDMAALGSTLLTLGERAETAGTATNAMFAKLAAADKGTKKFKAAMDEIGLSVAEVQKGMQVDATGTILQVLEAVSSLDAEKQLGVLVEMFGMEHADSVAKLANNVGEYRRQLELANGEAAKGSMSREFSARLETTTAQFQLMKNRVNELAVSFGSALLPAVNSTFAGIAPVVSAVSDFAREHPKVTQAVVGTVVALTSLKLAALATGYAFTFVKGGVLSLAAAKAKLSAEAVLLATRFPQIATGLRLVSAAFVSTGVGALVVGLATAGFLVWQHWDGVEAFLVGTFEGVRAGLQPVVDTFAAFYDSLSVLHPVFEAVGSALSSAWQWFTNLLAPVDYSAESLTKAGNAGKTFGELLAAGINIALTPLQMLIKGITWITNNIGGAVEKVAAFGSVVGEKASAVGSAVSEKAGSAWAGTKEFFGFGDSDQAPPVPSLPAPAMATARGQGGSSYTDQSTTTIQVVQQPGENSADFARRVAAEQERLRAVRQRSAMYDGASAP